MHWCTGLFGTPALEIQELGSEGAPKFSGGGTSRWGFLQSHAIGPRLSLDTRISSRTATREKLPSWSPRLPTRNKVGHWGDFRTVTLKPVEVPPALSRGSSPCCNGAGLKPVTAQVTVGKTAQGGPLLEP